MIYLVNCRIGKSCSHIGALLFKIEAAVRLGYTATAACTSKPCTWNDDFVSDIAGVKIKDVIFYKGKQNSATSIYGSTGLTNQSQTELLERLRSLPQKDKPVILSKFAETQLSDCQKLRNSRSGKMQLRTLFVLTNEILLYSNFFSVSYYFKGT